MSSLEENFQRLKEKVLQKRPVLRQILKKKGSKNLYEYAKEYIDVNLNPPIKKRQNEFLKTFKLQVTERLGADIAESAVEQLKKYYFVSTADHHGPISHPFFVNSNLLTAAPCLECPDPHLKNVIVLACANVSIDNHTFPRGLLFHSYAQEKLQLHRLAFFSANVRPPVVYSLAPYSTQDVDKIRHNLKVKVDKGEVFQKEADALYGIFDEIYSAPDVLASKSYSDQITKTNFHLWKKFFAPSHVIPPNLIYLELESLVVQLLIEHHLYQDTIINHFLFDPSYEPLIITYFEGIFGSFSREEMSGTYLFWALPKGARHCMQLWRKDNFLVSEDESYKIELKPEIIQKALEDKELIPGLLLDFVTVSFYYGLKCLGGFNQVNYLTLMKNGYIKMNVDRGNYRSIEVCARAQTKEICDGLTIAFLEYGKGELALATGLDLALYGADKTWSQFLEVSKSVTVEEALNPLMPEIYRITYTKDEWDPELVAIESQDIMKLTHMDEKIKPCAYITP